MLQIIEIISETNLRAVYAKLGVQVMNIFYKEFITEDEFIALFSGASHLYEVIKNDEPLGIVFLFAENPYAVKIGTAAYGERVPFYDILAALDIIRKKLRKRGVACLVAEVPAHKRNIRRLLPFLGFGLSGCVESYFGEEPLLIFSQKL